ncbi:MAG: molybdenum ABC transporter ATP-binding protein [Verrucomicrobiae bacterium]|nr:molybdenum ABC transporter ATP-binding protein [Verrucomicrobiae bacterium]NNJ42865.1 molybdenum ABC transporter ATP-binding protein [Akkermansiaceae bacterium]
MSIEARFHIDRGDFCLDVDTRFPRRGVSAVFGPSGSGKTTFLRAIAGLEKSDPGYLKVGDALWQDETQFIAPHRRAIGYVFQEPSLFDHLDVRRNIEYGRKRVAEDQRKVSVDDVVDLLGLGDLRRRFPHQLSGGEQQRVAIARALATSPAVMLMDEPLASLDEARKHEILPYFQSLHQELNIPMLYVSHSKDEVMRLADHMVVLHQGRIQATGNVADVFARMDLPLAHEPDAKWMIEGVVADQDAEFGLSYVDFSGGRFAVTHHDPADHQRLDLGNSVRLLIRASDVSITHTHAADTSILNVFPATVEEITQEGNAHVTIGLLLGSNPILGKITRKSAATLGLTPGMDVFIQIKSVAVLSSSKR